ncbi:MAG: hypothetical protein AAGI01_12615 [Myxococcota bacterium]
MSAEKSQNDQTKSSPEGVAPQGRDALPRGFMLASVVLLAMPSLLALLMIFLMESWSGVLVMLGTALVLLVVNGALVLFLSKRLRGGSKI